MNYIYSGYEKNRLLFLWGQLKNISSRGFLVFLVNLGLYTSLERSLFFHFRALRDLRRARVFRNMQCLLLFGAYGKKGMSKLSPVVTCIVIFYGINRFSKKN